MKIYFLTILNNVNILFYRLRNNNENNLSNQDSVKSKEIRRRRHIIRLVLIVLDYAIEFFGGSFMFIIFFVGENKETYSLLYQRILFCIGTFIYGTPIPIAYLFNEDRVRSVILNSGWAEGFRAIFYSDDTIRNLERQRRQSLLLRNDGFNGRLERLQSIPNSNHV